ncbi:MULTISPECIES: hypothetical protein [unclassified Dyella]|uniref:hypothetical protein n=1 Tax=unclassified Dyella TaxID=2634549 RepID=UPI000C845F59|nr:MULTISPECIES: hypothetical protein [unclassified Dyella]MDR3443755.1 hypothetical protein [Dyella sp.]PMQ04538.1 hypothetical protein DyAD56_13505 [Dyella sp. AD56]
MPTDRITPGSSLLETMRALAQGKAKSTGSSATASPTMLTGKDQAATTQAHSIEQLRQRLRTLLANVDPDDSDSTGRVRETTLREIILWEFGGDFRQNTQFQPMIERINQAMDIDERFHAQFVEMIRSLKK